MKLRSTSFAAILAVLFLIVTPVQAIITLGIETTLNLTTDPVTDTAGMNGATMRYTFLLAETYSNLGGFIGAVSTSAEVTVSGSSVPENNGTFSIADGTHVNFAFIPFFSNASFLMFDPNLTNADFTFGNAVSVSVHGLGSSLLGSAPSVGSTVEASHFNGITISNDAFNLGDGNYSFSNAPVTAAVVAVPEAQTVSALIGMLILGFIAYRRRCR